MLRRWRPLALFIAAIWLVQIVNFLLGQRLNGLGLEPRTLAGLAGIATAPFLHASFAHLASNTAGLATLGGLASLDGERRFIDASLFIALVGGLATWLFARGADHVGASGLVFGYFGFLLGRAWFERTFTTLLIALVVIGLYGTLLFGVLPSRGVSFEGHLFGLLAGVGAAFVLPARPPGRTRY